VIVDNVIEAVPHSVESTGSHEMGLASPTKPRTSSTAATADSVNLPELHEQSSNNDTPKNNSGVKSGLDEHQSVNTYYPR